MYKNIFILGFRKSYQYKINFYLSLTSVVFPLLIQFFMWTGIYSNDNISTVFGYEKYQMLAYCLFAVLISRIIQSGFVYEINSDIKNGGLAKYLVKPIDYMHYQFASYSGEKCATSLISSITIIGIWVFFKIHYHLPDSFFNVLFFFVSLVFSIILNFYIFFMAGCCAFWIIEAGGVIFILSLLINIISGGIFPLDIFPSGVQKVLKFLPFGYTNYFCSSILCNKLLLHEILLNLLLQLGWIIVCYLTAKLIWSFGLKKYIAVGD